MNCDECGNQMLDSEIKEFVKKDMYRFLAGTKGTTMRLCGICKRKDE